MNRPTFTLVENYIKEAKYDMAVGHLLLKSFWANEAVFQMMMLSYNLFLLFIFDFLCISEYRQQIKTFRLKYVFLAGKIIRTARYVVMKLSAKYPYKDVYEKCLSYEDVIEYSGVGFSVFDGVCLPYQIFCFTKNIRKIQDEVVPEMVQYRKFPQNSSPVGSK